MELAEKELAEVQVIEEFLPRQLDAGEVDAAIAAAKASNPLWKTATAAATNSKPV